MQAAGIAQGRSVANCEADVQRVEAREGFPVRWAENSEPYVAALLLVAQVEMNELEGEVARAYADMLALDRSSSGVMTVDTKRARHNSCWRKMKELYESWCVVPLGR